MAEPLSHIRELTPDPKNARKHTPRNIGTIVDALHDVGAGRSIVIDEHGVILAGNATTEAAAEAGITKVRVIDTDGDEIIAVRRSNLTPEQKTKLALYDNRSAELADGWDAEVLRTAAADGLDLSTLWAPDELAALLGEATAAIPTIPEAFQVLVTCKGESDQGVLLERLIAEGYVCRALIS